MRDGDLLNVSSIMRVISASWHQPLLTGNVLPNQRSRSPMTSAEAERRNKPMTR
jgi:hypothetical protein